MWASALVPQVSGLAELLAQSSDLLKMFLPVRGTSGLGRGGCWPSGGTADCRFDGVSHGVSGPFFLAEASYQKRSWLFGVVVGWQTAQNLQPISALLCGPDP